MLYSVDGPTTQALSGPLTLDDRVDAGAMAHFQRAMMIGVNQTAKAMKDP
jgi:hypothetical protein